MGRVYAVVSAKGGVGKTTTAANLAAALAAASPGVVVVDADLGMANLADTLGVDVGEVTLHDVLSGDADVAAAIHQGPGELAVVPGSPTLDAFSRADPERLEGVLDDLAAEYDYVVLDTGAGLSNDTVAPLTFVDEILLVSTPTRDALGDTDKTRRVAERLGATVAGAALVRADPADAESEMVVETLDAGVLGTIPDSVTIQQASDAGEPVAAFAPDSTTAAAFASLAAALTGEHVGAPEADAETADDPEPDADSSAAPSGDAADTAATDAPATDNDTEAADSSTPDGGSGTGDTRATAPERAEPDAEDTETDTDGEATAAAAPDAAAADDLSATDTEPAGAATAPAPDEEAAGDADAAGSTTGSAERSGADGPVVKPAEPDAASPVEPADPEAVAVADSDSDDDLGISGTPLEEVPIEAAEATGSAGRDPDSESPPEDAATGSEPGSDPDPDPDPDAEGGNADADDGNEEDNDAGGGFFSRLFG